MVYSAKADRYDQVSIRHVGKSGLVLPAISLGLWHKFSSADPLDARRKLLLAAFDHGIFHFDVANHYGDNHDFGSAESMLGEVLANELKPYRHELVIATKVGYEMHKGPFGTGTSHKAIRQSIDDSLQRLQTDYVDLYYAHRFDDQTPIEETVYALDEVVRQGKALYIGVSNYQTPQAREAIRLFKQLGTPFVANQMSYNMFNRNVETTGLTDVMREGGQGIVAYGPLSEGLLSDRYLKGIPADFPIHPTNKGTFKNGRDAVVKQLNALNELAQSRQQTLSQMALAWLLRDKVVASVLIGTTNIKHLEDNLAALAHPTFTTDELAAIDQILND